MIRRLSAALGLATFAPTLWAADALTGAVQKQPLNIAAIVMFVVFVAFTLYITYWASKKQDRVGLLLGRRQDHRFPERSGNCR